VAGGRLIVPRVGKGHRGGTVIPASPKKAARAVRGKANQPPFHGRRGCAVRPVRAYVLPSTVFISQSEASRKKNTIGSSLNFVCLLFGCLDG